MKRLAFFLIIGLASCVSDVPEVKSSKEFLKVTYPDAKTGKAEVHPFTSADVVRYYFSAGDNPPDADFQNYMSGDTIQTLGNMVEIPVRHAGQNYVAIFLYDQKGVRLKHGMMLSEQE